MRRKYLLLAAAMISLVLMASSASAQVQVRLRVIKATNRGSEIDPGLRDVHGQLGSLFNFTSYRLLRDESLTLAPNRPVEVVSRRGGRSGERKSMEITLVAQRREMAELKVRIKREDGTEILSTQVRIAPGKTVLIGGPRYAEGVIIFALSASF